MGCYRPSYSDWDRQKPFEEALLGKTVQAITQESEAIEFLLTDGTKVILYHDQDCCEHVRVEEIHGDLEDLLLSPILRAEESTNSDDPPYEECHSDSYTWTFYKLATIKGEVVIRWLGESNGYYSESVSTYVIPPQEDA